MQYQMEKLIRYKLIFYVPPSHVEVVKNSLFAAGAGRYNDYDQACWQCLGEGQFRPLPGANPAIGLINQLTSLQEYKVELLCDSNNIHEVINALKSSHPYEEPGYDVVKIEDF